MKIGTYNQLRILCVLSLAATFGLTGCKGVGSWKMPKMSWNREPSATTLAGTETPKLPESPANKYSPSTIASVGAGTTPGSSSGNRPRLMDTPDKLHQPPRLLPLDWLRPQTVTKPVLTPSVKSPSQPVTNPPPPQTLWPLASPPVWRIVCRGKRCQARRCCSTEQRQG